VKKYGKLLVYAAISVRFIGDEAVRDPRNQLHVILILSLKTLPEATPFADFDELYLQLLATLHTSNPGVVLDRFWAVVGALSRYAILFRLMYSHGSSSTALIMSLRCRLSFTQ
jgi:hypothetical protein